MRELFVPPVQEWEYVRGRPSWIPGGGRWARVVNRGGVVIEFPQGWPELGRKTWRPGTGAPPLEERKPETLLYAIWLKECVRESYRQVAISLGFLRDELPGAESSAKKKGERYVRRGRAHACALGIWPWACWEEGTPPTASWWTDGRLCAWLLAWMADDAKEITRRAVAPARLASEAIQRGILRSFEETQRALRRASEAPS